jgi:hypothetical protein
MCDTALRFCNHVEELVDYLSDSFCTKPTGLLFPAGVSCTTSRVDEQDACAQPIIQGWVEVQPREHTAGHNTCGQNAGVMQNQRSV